LVEDMAGRGMLDDTLVVLMGEMGRTPKVNKNAGRDHWTQCGFIVYTGAGVRHATVFGRSDKHAGWPVDYPVSSADHVATMYKLVGVDPRMPIFDRTGREHRAALDGDPIDGVIA
jgi:arylsulfatase A-like enzyme